MKVKRIAAVVLASGIGALYISPTAALASEFSGVRHGSLTLTGTSLMIPIGTDIPGLDAMPKLPKKPLPQPPAPEPPPIPDPPAGSWLNADNMANATAIVKVGQEMNLPRRAWEIAIATAMQESTLNNYGHLGDRNDHDSLGLFQQRPSMGWGTPEQVTDPVYASRIFYERLVQVPGWDSMPLTQAAQAVQNSAFPDAYAKHETLAIQVVSTICAC